MTTTQQVVITKLGDVMSTELVEIVLDVLKDATVVDHAVDAENYTVYTTIRSDSTIEQVKFIIRDAQSEGFGRCNHEHDCCGCYFLSMAFILPMFQDQKDYYIIKEVWARNV